MKHLYFFLAVALFYATRLSGQCTSGQQMVVTPAGAVCIGVDNFLTASGVGLSSYSWAPAIGLNCTTCQTVVAMTGSQEICYTVTGTDVIGCTTNTTVCVASTPLAGTISPSSAVVCSGNSQAFYLQWYSGNIEWQTSSDSTTWINTGITTDSFTLSNITTCMYLRVKASTDSCGYMYSTMATACPAQTPTVTAVQIKSSSVKVLISPFGTGQYDIAWSGAGTGAQTGLTTSVYTINNLASNSDITACVTLATPTCPGVTSSCITMHTLCAHPTGLALASPTDSTVVATWNAVTGAPAYRIYYFDSNNYNTWFYTDTAAVATAQQSKTLASLNGCDQYVVLVAALDCPAAGVIGDTAYAAITVAPCLSCTGTPNAGIAIAPSGACSSQSFMLMDTTAEQGGGLSYRWQFASSAAGPWNNTSYTTPIAYWAQSNPTYYRYQVTCSYSGQIATSNVVYVPMNTFINCYCVPVVANGASVYGAITNVTLNTLNNNSSYPTTPPYYTSYSIGTNLNQGTQTLAVTHSGNDVLGVWIDWNQNGTFDASEYYFVGIDSSGVSSTSLVNITAPASSTLGPTRMRIRSEKYNLPLGPANACSNTQYGETEDYLVSYIPTPYCNGAPSGGTIIGPNAVPSNQPFVLTDNTTTNTGGIAFQWQSSPDSATWTNVTNATGTAMSTSTTATTYYRVMVVCTTSSDTAYSNLFTVNIGTCASPFVAVMNSPLGGGNVQFTVNPLYTVSAQDSLQVDYGDGTPVQTFIENTSGTSVLSHVYADTTINYTACVVPYSLCGANTSAPGTTACTAVNFLCLYPPIISNNTTQPTCGSANGAINIAVTNGAAPYVYTWSNGATAQNLANLSNGYYGLSVTDANGCSNTASYTLWSAPAVTLNISTAQDSAGNWNLTANTMNGFPPFTYNWNNGDTAQTITGLPPGIYCVTATDTAGCSASLCDSVNTIFTVTINGQFINATALMPVNVYADDTVAYLNAVNGTFVVTFPVISLNDTVHIAYSDCYGFGHDTSFVPNLITVYFVADYCPASLVCDTLYHTYYCACDTSFTLALDTVATAWTGTFYWDFGDGTSDTIMAPVHTYAVNGLYNVCLSLVAPNGNTMCTYCHVIGIDSAGNVHTRMDQTGFIMKVLPYGTSGVKQLPEQSFNVYPNPVDNYAVVALYARHATPCRIEVYNTLGQRIKTFDTNAQTGSNRLTLPLANLCSGTYLLTARFDGKQINRIFTK